MQTTLCMQAYREEPALYMAMELSDRRWRLVFSDGMKKRSRTVEALDREPVLEEIKRARRHFRLDAECAVVSCYEAGWEGFWLHRWLCSQGVVSHVVDSASIEVNRRARRSKSDRIDGDKLMDLLLRYCHGERGALAVVRVPSVEAEGERCLPREREVLVRERGRHWVRIKSLLRGQGLRVQSKHKFLEQLAALRTFDGRALPPDLRAEIEREWARHQLVDAQIRTLEQQQRERLKATAGDAAASQIEHLMALRSVGPQSAWVLVMEFFAWRTFRNRRELAALAGLAPTPYQSGEEAREQGISKAGNRRVRRILIELVWQWLRYQPFSALSRWFETRFGRGSSRNRRVGIVALARKLLVALWRYLNDGALPEGAILRG